mmetsp:Transcript_55326/g.111069  ORF Transcript_55326/g.111069 Transcript_55326/m.111069 type:complete len:168 (+) Transcript_55326:97-600(+)
MNRRRDRPIIGDDISLDDLFSGDDQYGLVTEACEEKGKFDAGDVCYDNYKCSWLHKVDPLYKCELGDNVMAQLNQTSTVYCCTSNGIDVCCEPNPLPVAILAVSCFIANVVALLLVCRFCKKPDKAVSLSRSGPQPFALLASVAAEDHREQQKTDALLQKQLYGDVM